MNQPLWTVLLMIVCFSLMSGCKPKGSGGSGTSGRGSLLHMKVTSSNEPKTDSDALALVGIAMTSPPVVEYRNFQAGMDDHFDLVIRFPKDQIENFWSGSKWSKVDAKRINEMTPRSRKHFQERTMLGFGGVATDPLFKALRSSADGIWCQDPKGSNVGLKVYLAWDLDPENVVAYVEWFQT